MLSVDFVDAYKCRSDSTWLKKVLHKKYKDNYLKNVILSRETLQMLRENLNNQNVIEKLASDSVNMRYKTINVIFYDYSFLLIDRKLNSPSWVTKQRMRKT